MKKERLNDHVTTKEMIITMCEGNPGALNTIMQLMEEPYGYRDISLCDLLEIRGTELYMLYNDCCDQNNGKFHRTLMMIKEGIFTFDEVKQNLSLTRAIPFIDDNIVIKDVPAYGHSFNSSHYKWNEYCAKNRASFIRNLIEAIDDEKIR